MQISTNFKDIVPNPQKPSGGYEWWYFDGISTDKEWAFVIIFYQGNPFSPDYIQNIDKNNAKPEDFPAVSISVYHKSKIEFYSFVEFKKSDFKWEGSKLTIGNNSFTQLINGNSISYNISINEELASTHSIQADLNLKSQVIESLNLNSNNTEDNVHTWNLIQPHSIATGNFNIVGKSGTHSVELTANAYHDHNTGLEPMKNDFDDWYWGRFHFGEYTLIYYIMNKMNNQQHQAWLLDNDTLLVDEFSSAELSLYGFNAFGLKSARKIELTSNKAEITIQTSKIVDNGPFYQRFFGEAILTLDDKLLTSNGISEYIKPNNIYSKKFWPLVKMRLRFNSKKPHWVQKSKNLYEWTW